MEVLNFRLLSTSTDDATSELETNTMLNTLYINIWIFAILMICFELYRHNKLIYLKRVCSRFIVRNYYIIFYFILNSI